MVANAKVLVGTKDMSREEWLNWRLEGIGGSEASAIAGVNKYKSPVAVYLDKIGEGKPQEENEYMYWGNVLEDTVAREFSKRTGLKVQKRNFMYQHPEYPFMLANIDRWVTKEKAGLECKTSSAYRAHEWEGEKVPDEYAIQCNHYMAVTGAPHWYLAVLIGGNTFKHFRIDRDEELINYLIQIEKDFWENNVLKKMPPAFTGQDTDILKWMYSNSEQNSSVYFDYETSTILSRANEAKRELERWKTEFEEAKNQIKGLMGNNEIALMQSGEEARLVATWKANKKGVRTFKLVGEDE